MSRLKPGSQCDRLLAILLDGEWHGGPHELGTLWHKASTRMGELERVHKYAIEKRDHVDAAGKFLWKEYRLIGFPTRSLPELLEAASAGGAGCS